VGLTTIFYTDLSGDCYCGSGGSPFDNTDVEIFLKAHGRMWFPFTIFLSKGAKIVSATFSFTAAATSGAGSGNCDFGCEASDNVSNPVDGADLQGRTFTTAINSTSYGQFIKDTVYNFDVTASIQEIINRSGWSFGNTLAVLEHETSGVFIGDRRLYSYQNGTSVPSLTVVVNPSLPQVLGVS
jgi:hypothetical protein